jgi:predicted enzyme related to lactoylglutathione lyase
MKIVKKYPDGVFSWVDLTTTDIHGAQAFYSGLFGWEIDEGPAETGYYTQFRINGHSVAGAGQMMPEMMAGGAPSVWTSYINVGTLTRPRRE